MYHFLLKRFFVQKMEDRILCSVFEKHSTPMVQQQRRSFTRRLYNHRKRSQIHCFWRSDQISSKETWSWKPGLFDSHPKEYRKKNRRSSLDLLQRFEFIRVNYIIPSSCQLNEIIFICNFREWKEAINNSVSVFNFKHKTTCTSNLIIEKYLSWVKIHQQ